MNDNDVEWIRKIILQVIAERTMPHEYAAPDDDRLVPYYRLVEDRLVPYYRLVEDRQALNRIIDDLRLEIATLKRRIERLEAIEPR